MIDEGSRVFPHGFFLAVAIGVWVRLVQLADRITMPWSRQISLTGGLIIPKDLQVVSGRTAKPARDPSPRLGQWY